MFLMLARSEAITHKAATANIADINTSLIKDDNGNPEVLGDNDTIILPPGQVNWGSSLLAITKNISLIGAGGGQTQITGAGHQTGNGAPMLSIQSNNNTPPLSGQPQVRISGITFIGVGAKPIIEMDGFARMNFNVSTSKWEGGVRFDHNVVKWTPDTYCIYVSRNGWINGVIDHNLWDNTACHPATDPTCQSNSNPSGTPPFAGMPAGETMIFARAAAPDTPSAGGAQYDWSVPYPFATYNPIFFENNIVLHKGAFMDTGTAAGSAGGSMCARYNTSYGALGGQHGTETGSNPGNGFRGQRGGEVLNNYFYLRSAQGGLTDFNATGVRSGPMVLVNNRYDGWRGKEQAYYGFRNTQNMGVLGGASGYSCWDKNDHSTTGPLGASTGVQDDDASLSSPFRRNLPGPTGTANGTLNYHDAWYTTPALRSNIYWTGAAPGDITNHLLVIPPGSGNPPMNMTATDAWQGYTLVVTNKWDSMGGDIPQTGPDGPAFGVIRHSSWSLGTGTTLNIGGSSQPHGFGSTPHLTAGASIEIRHVLELADTAGSGGGILLKGKLPTVAASTWPNAMGTYLGEGKEGLWMWDCLSKTESSTPGYQTFSTTTGTRDLGVQWSIGIGTQTAGSGGVTTSNIHEETMTILHGGIIDYPGTVTPITPTPGNTRNNNRGVGADWNDPTGTIPPTVNDGTMGTADQPASFYKITVNQAYGLPPNHPLVNGGVITAMPKINGSSATFSVGTTPNCATNTNCFKVTTSNFSGTPSFTPAPTPLPANVSFTDNADGTATFTGNAVGAAPTPYPVTLTATYVPASETATQPFTINVVSPNQPPTVSMAKPFPNATYDAPATVSLFADASDLDGNVVSVSFYDNGTTLINSAVTSPPYKTVWTNVPIGSHSITARATDNAGATANSTSVGFSVRGVSTPAPPARIIVKP